MGAEEFFIKKIGSFKSAKDAFNEAKDEAYYEYGHSGYTGSIAEKHDFKMVDVPKGEDPNLFVSKCLDNNEGFWDDKWGPAGCVEVLEPWLKKERGEHYKGVRNFKVFYFFGWASS